MDIDTRKWDAQLVRECGGDELKVKLGADPVQGGKSVGRIGKWWRDRFGFSDGEWWLLGSFPHNPSRES